MDSKTLLLHGPIKSFGINFLTSQIHESPEARKKASAMYCTEENIKSLIHIFRGNGYRIFYSAWAEDEKWFAANKDLFDFVCVSNQSSIPDSVEFQGRLIQNNKQKLYFSIRQGLAAIRREIGESVVVRLRSDVAVDFHEVEKATVVARSYRKSFLIEYAKADNPLFIPDFITVGDVDTHLILYENLVNICKENGGYHISSHIDHGIQLLKMKSRSELSHVICMSRGLHESMVWRGLPRYYSNKDKEINKDLFFDCVLSYPENYDVESAIRGMHPQLRGRPGGFMESIESLHRNA
jgi:hypothetical protein